jgi:hypothetical protein
MSVIVYSTHVDHRSKQVDIMINNICADEKQAHRYIADREFGGRYFLLYYTYSLTVPSEKDIKEKYPEYFYNYIDRVPSYCFTS